MLGCDMCHGLVGHVPWLGVICAMGGWDMCHG